MSATPAATRGPGAPATPPPAVVVSGSSRATRRRGTATRTRHATTAAADTANPTHTHRWGPNDTRSSTASPAGRSQALPPPTSERGRPRSAPPVTRACQPSLRPSPHTTQRSTVDAGTASVADQRVRSRTVTAPAGAGAGAGAGGPCATTTRSTSSPVRAPGVVRSSCGPAASGPRSAQGVSATASPATSPATVASMRTGHGRPSSVTRSARHRSSTRAGAAWGATPSIVTSARPTGRATVSP